ncbi:MAG: hypothetical protein OXC53_02180 [Rhodobacteraceae bacterium]|nr:hypothetical protein [Paracoccaceae bacterium]
MSGFSMTGFQPQNSACLHVVWVQLDLPVLFAQTFLWLAKSAIGAATGVIRRFPFRSVVCLLNPGFDVIGDSPSVGNDYGFCLPKILPKTKNSEGNIE